MTNTNLQHYSGDQHLSNFSQIFFCIPNFFLSAAVGLCALAGIIRLFRGEKKIGNFFVDMWRVVIYIFLPVAFVLSLVFVQQGMPMTYRSSYQVSTLEPAAMGTTDSGQPKQQTIVVGPLAAFVPQKMLGTNGGGFYGMNSAHPLENPTALTNFLTTFAMMIFPFCLVLMYGRMLGRFRHSLVIFSVMLLMFVGTIVSAIYYDTLKPNPGLTAHPIARSYEIASASAPSGKLPVNLPAVAGLPVDQHLGNLEGKEMRFGTSAGATFAAVTVDVTCGAVNAEHDSLNPMASLSPMVGMWLNCIFGGKGVGMINAALPGAGDLYCRPDGGTNARVSWQENRRPRDEAGHDCPASASDDDSDAHRNLCRYGLGAEGHKQSWPARIFPDGVPVFIGLSE